jgi:hypothetical protein
MSAGRNPSVMAGFCGFNWDDDIPNSMESHKIHDPNHQPDGQKYQL